MDAFFITLLVICAVATVWFAGFVIYRLFAGQR
jgi:hypothetical protein